jgi:hypothetical protein
LKEIKIASFQPHFVGIIFQQKKNRFIAKIVSQVEVLLIIFVTNKLYLHLFVSLSNFCFFVSSFVRPSNQTQVKAANRGR